MQNQKMLPSPIPWYRTRWFWGVVIGVAMAWSLFTYFILLPSGNSLSGILSGILYASGAGFFALLGAKLSGSSFVGTVIGILHLLILLFLVYKTFSSHRVSPLYPIIAIILFAFGNWVGVGYLSGL